MNYQESWGSQSSKHIMLGSVWTITLSLVVESIETLLIHHLHWHPKYHNFLLRSSSAMPINTSKQKAMFSSIFSLLAWAPQTISKCCVCHWRPIKIPPEFTLPRPDMLWYDDDLWIWALRSLKEWSGWVRRQAVIHSDHVGFRAEAPSVHFRIKLIH